MCADVFIGWFQTLYPSSIPTPTYLNGDASLVNGGVSSMKNLYSTSPVSTIFLLTILSLCGYIDVVY